MKPKVAFFDFACCEGCQLQVANLEEDIIGIVELVDLVEFREVMTGTALEYDIAFIEGSITRKQDEERLRDIRNRTKFLIAYGACATTGGVNKIKNLRNLDQVRQEVYGADWDKPHLDTYPTKAVDEVVKVDYHMHGCPINREELVRVVKSLVMGIVPKVPDYPVCVECKLKENECMYDLGKICLGPITRAGCGAICPTNGAPCEGCRGTIPDPNKNAMHEVLQKHNVTINDIVEKFTMFAITPEVSK